MNNIQWFPGHMQKARRQMEEQLKLVDIVIELRDARIPLASANPVLLELANNKQRLIILNKADMADENKTKKWQEYFISEGNNCLIIDSLNERNTNKVVEEVKEILKDKLEKAKARGIRKKVLRAMVCGIPNVGKSTFINNIVKKKAAKAENRPGVTKKLQWIRINEDVELLDTPGVLWPKFEGEEGVLLALLGSINDDVLNKEELLVYGLNYIKNEYPGYLNKRYKIDEKNNDLIASIAKKKLWLRNDGEVNTDTAYSLLLKDIRNANIGRISFENAPE